MLLSIIIPTFNRFLLLKQCLTSLCRDRATTSETEIIVVDDGSAPGQARQTKELCAVLGVMYHYRNRNAGAAAARNYGIEKSSGTWVAFIDDDVCVETGWEQQCLAALRACSGDVLGIEGRVRATGKGVWDREVENTAGGLFLSCHIYYRRYALEAAGKFDEHFSSKYPSCEDQELACRILMHGSIVFRPDLCALHLPRTIRLARYIRDSNYRILTLLEAELYFYLKHRDRYHTMRHARTFWGTYAAIALRHFYVTVKRRSINTLLAHPLQSAALLLSCVLEQICALALYPRLVKTYLCPPYQFFGSLLDEKRTRQLWRLAADAPLTALALKPNVLRAFLFPVVRLPVYSPKPLLIAAQKSSSLSEMRIFLRIDDVFFNDDAAVNVLCDALRERRIGYCAAVTGNDVTLPRAQSMLMRIVENDGSIGLHGFTHRGHFGPFTSELMQIRLAELGGMIQGLLSQLPESLRPKIFIPPFNAINREQILYCARFFKVICGGPETARFTDGYLGPVALPGNAWYFASVQPLYDTARAMLQSTMLREIRTYKGFACITVHMPAEARDGFSSLIELIDRLSDLITPWDYFFAK